MQPASTRVRRRAYGWDEYRAYDSIVSMMRQGRLTAPGFIQPLVSLDEGPAVWDLIVNKPEEVVKFGIRF